MTWTNKILTRMATYIHNIKMYRISALEETEYHLDVSTKKLS